MFNFNLNNKQMIKNEKYYKYLKINKNATQTEIKKSYYKLAKTLHPDKGGDTEEFKKIMEAYEVLSNEEKRKIYDEYGEEGLTGNINHNMNAFNNIFNMHHFNSMNMNMNREKRKSENIIFNLSITLNDFYNGIEKKLKLNKKIICNKCLGNGLKNDKIKTECSKCNGKGIEVIIRRLGPMTQQIQMQCKLCNGEGKIIEECNKCEICKGKYVINGTKILTIYIEKGMKNGEKIIFREEGDEYPNTIPGDLIIILNEVKHKFFKREGNDLWIKKTISLADALTEYNFIIKHLDNRKIKICSEKGITKPNSIKMIENEGMPEYKNPFNKGKLLIKINVKFPETIPLKYHDNLMKILKKDVSKELESKNIDDTLFLKNFDYEKYKKEQKDKESDEDEDNEYIEHDINECKTQ